MVLRSDLSTEVKRMILIAKKRAVAVFVDRVIICRIRPLFYEVICVNMPRYIGCLCIMHIFLDGRQIMECFMPVIAFIQGKTFNEIWVINSCFHIIGIAIRETKAARPPKNVFLASRNRDRLCSVRCKMYGKFIRYRTVCVIVAVSGNRSRVRTIRESYASRVDSRFNSANDRHLPTFWHMQRPCVSTTFV